MYFGITSAVLQSTQVKTVLAHLLVDLRSIILKYTRTYPKLLHSKALELLIQRKSNSRVQYTHEIKARLVSTVQQAVKWRPADRDLMLSSLLLPLPLLVQLSRLGGKPLGLDEPSAAVPNGYNFVVNF